MAKLTIEQIAQRAAKKKNKKIAQRYPILGFFTHKPWGFLPIGYKVKDGAIWKGDELIETPDEEDIFRICGMNFIYPEDRSNYGH